MNNNKYKELIEQIKREKKIEEKTNLLATMVFMVATNDIDTIYKNQSKFKLQLRRFWIGIILIIAAIIAMKPELPPWLLIILGKLF